jgi:hypothetical protein
MLFFLVEFLQKCSCFLAIEVPAAVHNVFRRLAPYPGSSIPTESFFSA